MKNNIRTTNFEVLNFPKNIPSLRCKTESIDYNVLYLS